MIRAHLGSLALALVAAGCAAEARIERLHLDLAAELATGHDDQAEELERAIRQLANQRWGEPSMKNYDVRNALARTYGNWQRTAHATKLASATVADMEHVYGVGDPRVTYALIPLARSYLCAFDWKHAEGVIDTAAAICRRPEARSDPDGTCDFYADLAINYLYLEAGAYRKSVDAFLLMNNVRHFPPDWVTRESMLTALGRQYAEGGFYPEAAWYLQRCVEEARGRFERPPATAGTFWRSSSGDVETQYVESAHAFQSQAPKCLDDLIELRRKTGDDAAADLLEHWHLELWSRGPDLAGKLEARARRTDETQRSDLLTAYDLTTVGYYYSQKDRPADAIRAYAESVRRVDRLSSWDQRSGCCPYGLRILDQMLGLGDAHERAGHLIEAETVYRRADEIAARELNPHHKWRLETLARLARTQSSQGHFESAEASWRSYLERAVRLRGNDHADYAFGLNGLAQAMAGAGRATEAAAASKHAAAVWKDYSRRMDAAADLPLPASLLSSPSPAN